MPASPRRYRIWRTGGRRRLPLGLPLLLLLLLPFGLLAAVAVVAAEVRDRDCVVLLQAAPSTWARDSSRDGARHGHQDSGGGTVEKQEASVAASAEEVESLAAAEVRHRAQAVEALDSLVRRARVAQQDVLEAVDAGVASSSSMDDAGLVEAGRVSQEAQAMRYMRQALASADRMLANESSQAALQAQVSARLREALQGLQPEAGLRDTLQAALKAQDTVAEAASKRAAASQSLQEALRAAALTAETLELADAGQPLQRTLDHFKDAQAHLPRLVQTLDGLISDGDAMQGALAQDVRAQESLTASALQLVKRVAREPAAREAQLAQALRDSLAKLSASEAARAAQGVQVAQMVQYIQGYMRRVSQAAQADHAAKAAQEMQIADYFQKIADGGAAASPPPPPPPGGALLPSVSTS